MKYLLYHSPGWSPGPIAEVLAAEQVKLEAVESADRIRPDHHPTAYLLDGQARVGAGRETLARLKEAGVALVALGLPGELDVPADLPSDLLSGFLQSTAGPRQLLVGLRAAFQVSASALEHRRAREESAARLNELTELADIGVQLTTEKNLETLLDLILTQARRVTHSDAGSLYIAETSPAGERRLCFKLSQNFSRPDIPFVEFSIPIDHASLAGYAATEGSPLVIEDVYTLPPEVQYSFNRSFDERYGYRTKSMLVIPMQNHHGEVIGVLQLINRKRDPEAKLGDRDAEDQIIPFSAHTVKIVNALASQ
ncbi:MAG TPA: GAF domain-containing protein, partial [Gemmatimonadales bacterium]|nr:GAF domain-containing protein [Gemmatimonadales bacterium]